MFDAEWLERLDEDQRAAVTHEGGPLAVLAGAGTGKTTTLTSRVAWLVANGTPAERVLLLTFTRRAASEMLRRSARLLRDADAAGRVVGGTFHSVAHRLLRANAAAVGLPDGFAVLDAVDAADLLDLVREEQGHAGAGRRFPRKATLADIYGRVVATQRPLSVVVSEQFPWCGEHLEALGAIFRSYVERKRAAGLVDFDDLLLHWRALLRHDVAGPPLAQQWDHVLVDEYQDVNDVQADLVRLLRREDHRVSVVGDDMQAIYGFRAASAGHLLAFREHFGDAATVVLRTNYRSTQPVLDAAYAVTRQVADRPAVRLHAAAGGGEQPELVVCPDEGAQTEQVCTRVLAAREAGVLLRDQAVLVRAAHHSDALELELARRRIPYRKYGGLRFLEAAHVKDLVAAFRLADNVADEMAWFRLLQLAEGVGPATARRVVVALGVRDVPTPAEVRAAWPGAAVALPGAATPLLGALVDALTSSARTSTAARADLVRAALSPLIEVAYDDADARLADLDVLVAAAQTSERLSDVAADLALDPPASTGTLAGQPALDEDYLVISTVHSAKGLEWSVVHLLHAADGNFPSDMALRSAEGLEEERRLFYVGLTRARRALHVYAPVRYHHHPRALDDRHNYAQLSRFLDEDVQAVMRRTTVVAPQPAVAGVQVAAAIDAELDALWG